jgi:hypothetical protein
MAACQPCTSGAHVHACARLCVSVCARDNVITIDCARFKHKERRANTSLKPTPWHMRTMTACTQTPWHACTRVCVPVPKQ